MMKLISASIFALIVATASAQVTVTSEDLDIRSKDVRAKIVAAVKGDSNFIGYVKDGSKISFNDGIKDLGGRGPLLR